MAITVLIGLCVLPASKPQGSVVVALNPDAGETVGWPRFTKTVATVYRSLPVSERDRTAIFTQNYGEAGAIAHFGPSLGLPYPYGGRNGWALWGPLPNADTVALLVGLDRQQAAAAFIGCEIHTRIDDGVGPSNNERWFGTAEANGAWSALWPSLRGYD